MSTTNTLFNLSDIKNSNDQILTSISNLSGITTDITNNLSILRASGIDSGSPLSTVYNNLSGKITEIDGIQNNLHRQIDQINTFYENGLTSMTTLQDQQKKVTDIINKETDINNKRLETIKTEQNNKMRLVEINSYYSKKYETQSEIMKIIIINIAMENYQLTHLSVDALAKAIYTF